MKQIFIAASCVLVFAGCSPSNSPSPAEESQNVSHVNQEKAGGKGLGVVVSFYPLAYMAERVGGDAVRVTNIVGASDPHDYTLSPRDIQTFQDADVVLLQGAELEPWGDDIVQQLSDQGTVTIATENIALIEVDDDHGDADKHGDEHEGEDEHGHGAFDPHTWLDPVLAQGMVSSVQSALIAADPENADLYTANATALTTEFAELDSAYTQALQNCARRDVIFSHDAFGYLAKRYNFTAHAIAGISSQDEPSAKTLATLKEEAAEGITHILAEETSVNRFAQTLSDEAGLAMLPISALASPDEDGGDFIERSRDNLVQIQTALNCTL